MERGEFKGAIGRYHWESEPYWPPDPAPPPGAPNVLVILLDDVGFAQLGCFGSDIATPTFDRLAAEGLRYTNFHTTALCSPTRACVLTGRNHHTCGMGRIAELATGFPGYDACIPRSCGFLPEMVTPHGYAAYAVGKWHLTPDEELHLGARRDRWPLGRGFERFYGFFGGETHQFVPALVHDNHFVDPPRSYEDGYHLTEDLVSHAIEYLEDLRRVPGAHRRPGRPADRMAATVRRARPHPGAGAVGQRGLVGGRAGGLAQRRPRLELVAPHPGGSGRPPGRDRWPPHPQQLPLGLDGGGQHALPPLEARDARGGCGRSAHRPLAGRDRSRGRGAPPIRARHRPGPHDPRGDRHRRPGDGRRRRATADRGHQLRLQLRRPRRAGAPHHAVLRDVRVPGHLPRRLEGGRVPPDPVRRPGSRPGRLGALPPAGRSVGVPRPRGRAARSAGGPGRAVVDRGRPPPGAAPRQPALLGAGARTTPPGGAPPPVRLPPRPVARARERGRQRQEPATPHHGPCVPRRARPGRGGPRRAGVGAGRLVVSPARRRPALLRPQPVGMAGVPHRGSGGRAPRAR